MRKSVKLLTHPLCLSPCPPFCSFYWKTCSGTVKLLSVQRYQSLLLRMMKRRSWPALYCHTGHRRAVAKVLGKHPHPLGNWPGAGSTTQLGREEKQMTGGGKNTIILTWLVLKVCFLLQYWSETTYSHPSCRTSASWSSSEWQFQHKLSDVPSAPREASYSQAQKVRISSILTAADTITANGDYGIYALSLWAY